MALDTSSINQKLAELQAEFKQQLPEAIVEIRSQWARLCQGEPSDDDVIALHIKVHGLTGASGTFGAQAVSKVSAEIEGLIKQQMVEQQVIDSSVQRIVDDLLDRLEQVASSWTPTTAPYLPPIPGPRSYAQGNELICLVEDDLLVAKDIIAHLEKAGYQVRHFARPEDFEAVMDEIQPDAVLMDMIFDGSSLDGAECISNFRERSPHCPVIFISNQAGVGARLAATRAGALRYFTKPLDIKKLVQTMDNLFSRQPDDLYRILLIDDDEVLLDYYSSVLREANMNVEALSDPIECIHVMERFIPDLILLDIYMPSCSGMELAQVIRQDDEWAHTPIVFLSTEPDIDRQLLALNLGGDDFLNKSVEPQHLLQAVYARAKRSRWSSEMNISLRRALRDSEYKNITLDEHAIVSITDVAGRITYANDKFCEISGYTRRELLGQNHRMLKSGCHSKSFYQDMWNCISSGKVWHGTICNRTKGGDEYWVESTIVPFLDENGRPYQFVAARTDITQVRVNEDRLNRSQEYANIGTWDWNIQTGALYWSERIAPLFGYSKGEIQHTYENFLKSVHPDDRQYVVDAVNNCVYHGAHYDIEHRVLQVDGTVRWVHERGDVVRDEDNGKPLHMLGVVQDITQRKQAQLALQESEALLRTAQQIGQIGNWSRDMKTGKVTWSDEAFRIFGFEPGAFEVSFERFISTVHSDDIKPLKQSIQNAIESGSKHSIDHRIILPDGEIRWVHEEGEAVRNDQGEVVLLHGTVQDISDRIWSEHLQAGHNEILELIANNSPLEKILTAIVLHAEQMLPGVMGSIMLLDDSGSHLHCATAPHLPRLFIEALDGIEIGLNVGTCCASAVQALPLIVSDIQTHPNWQEFQTIVIEANLHACWSLPILAADGRVLGTCDMYYNEVKTPDERGMGLVTDLAKFAAIAIEQKQALKKLVDAKQEAENANKAKSHFLSSMSHELRTPMNAIIGFSQLLEMDFAEMSEVQQDNVQEIMRAGKHLLELINEILDLSKIEAGYLDLDIEPVDISMVMGECLKLIAPLSERHGINISLLCNNEELSFEAICQRRMTVLADRTRLKQVLFNLLSNAVKYNRKNGRITVSCSATSDAYIRLSVTDTGAGMSENNQSQLFKAFNRFGAEKTDIEGTGIGLVITKKIMDKMKGRIGMESQLNVGSTFWIELPVSHDVTTDSEDVADEPEKMTVAEDMRGEQMQGEQIYTMLYVEDNPANLRLIEQ
ncbi:MAG: PAS domain-containing protein, partial [Gammaproteobacteria bacterium]|nr:PAS domain-containing protein [Gammaproteobacteria bacterium]